MVEGNGPLAAHAANSTSGNRLFVANKRPSKRRLHMIQKNPELEGLCTEMDAAQCEIEPCKYRFVDLKHTINSEYDVVTVCR